jgi:predicted Rossmann fold flavoprotein
MMCAIAAGGRGRRVLLIDHADTPGPKILISGGGRCNFTNLEVTPERFISRNPHFCKSAISRYTQDDFVSMVRRHRIAYHEKTLGQLFCDGSARQIVAMLTDECAKARVDLRLRHRITSIEKPDRFRVATDRGDFTSDTLVLATGGLSIPKLGATGFAYDVARRFGCPLVETRPGLVPLTFEGDVLWMCRQLTGVSVDAVVSCGDAQFRENILFTHRGLSGPAILQISSYWREGDSIAIDLMPATDARGFLRDRKRSRPKALLARVLGEVLPTRLAAAHAASYRDIGNIPDRELDSIAARLNSWKLTSSGTEGYAKAEVTVGGIDTNALSSRTMGARGVPGLFAIGEAVDVTGWLGGYNFQWAWSSGWCAGQEI